MSSDLGRETGALDVAPGWPDHDPWPPDPQEPMHPLVAAARRVAKQVVEPRAAQIEDHGVDATSRTCAAVVALQDDCRHRLGEAYRSLAALGQADPQRVIHTLLS